MLKLWSAILTVKICQVREKLMVALLGAWKNRFCIPRILLLSEASDLSRLHKVMTQSSNCEQACFAIKPIDL